MSFKHKIVFVDKTKQKDDMFCSLCKYPFLKKEDFDLYENYKLCHECYLTFAESRKNEWSKGWRPTKERLANYLKERKQF